MHYPHPAEYGAAYGGGFYGGQIVVAGIVHAIAWAPKAEGEARHTWLPDEEPVDGALSTCDSMANTLAMAAAHSPLAQAMLALEINGHKDWCLPARDVLELAYRHLKPGTYSTGGFWRDGENPSSVPPGVAYASSVRPVQTSAEAFKAGGAEAFEEDAYWSSTQYSARLAYSQRFTYGRQRTFSQGAELPARAVRLIPPRSFCPLRSAR